MPILLTTPADPGDNDAGNTYPRLKIYKVQLDTLAKELLFSYGCGDIVDSVWKHGNGLRTKDVTIADDASVPHTKYSDMVAALSNDGETVYAGAERLLYQYLLDEGIAVGAIE